MPYQTPFRATYPVLLAPDTNNQAAVARDTFENDGSTLLLVHNASAASRTASVEPDRLCAQGHVHVIASSPIVAGGRAILGPFPVSRYGRRPFLLLDDPTSVNVYPFRAGA